MTTYTIPLENLPTFDKRFAKLVKAAEKIGAAVPVRRNLREIEREVKNAAGGVERVYSVVEVEVEGTAPVIEGWQFVAVLEHTDEGNIIRRVPGSDESVNLEAFRCVPALCHHCNLVRRRNDTYVVVGVENGTIKQVGSSCLKDFTGHADPHAYARLAEMLIDFDLFADSAEDEYLGGGGGTSVTSLRWVLHRTLQSIRAHGWASRSKSERGCATADRIWDKHFKGDPLPGDDELVESAIEWVRTMDAGDNDYLWNLRTVCKHDYIGPRQDGIAASLITAYQRTLDRGGKDWVGEPGKKYRTDVTLTRIGYRQGWDGYSSPIYNFVDGEGNKLVWFATNTQPWNEGDKLTIEGTVKKHDEFRGEKQTIINRVKEI